MTVARTSPKIIVVGHPEEQKLLIFFSSAPSLPFLSCGLSLFRFSVPLPKAHSPAHRGLPKATLSDGSSFIQSLPSASVHLQQAFAGPEDPSPADGRCKRSLLAGHGTAAPSVHRSVAGIALAFKDGKHLFKHACFEGAALYGKHRSGEKHSQPRVAGKKKKLITDERCTAKHPDGPFEAD